MTIQRLVKLSLVVVPLLLFHLPTFADGEPSVLKSDIISFQRVVYLDYADVDFHRLSIDELKLVRDNDSINHSTYNVVSGWYNVGFLWQRTNGLDSWQRVRVNMNGKGSGDLTSGSLSWDKTQNTFTLHFTTSLEVKKELHDVFNEGTPTEVEFLSFWNEIKGSVKKEGDEIKFIAEYHNDPFIVTSDLLDTTLDKTQFIIGRTTNLSISSVALQSQDAITKEWLSISEPRIVEGTPLKIFPTITNSGTVPVEALVEFTDESTGQRLPNGLVTSTFKPGNETVSVQVDTTGWAWADNGTPLLERKIRVRLTTPEGEELSSKVETIKVLSRLKITSIKLNDRVTLDADNTLPFVIGTQKDQILGDPILAEAEVPSGYKADWTVTPGDASLFPDHRFLDRLNEYNAQGKTFEFKLYNLKNREEVYGLESWKRRDAKREPLSFTVIATLLDPDGKVVLGGGGNPITDKKTVTQSKLGQLRQEYVDHPIQVPPGLKRDGIPVKRVPDVGDFVKVSALPSSLSTCAHADDCYDWALVSDWDKKTYYDIQSIVAVPGGIVGGPYPSLLTVSSVFRNPVRHWNVYHDEPIKYTLGSNDGKFKPPTSQSQHMWGAALDLSVSQILGAEDSAQLTSKNSKYFASATKTAQTRQYCTLVNSLRANGYGYYVPGGDKAVQPCVVNKPEIGPFKGYIIWEGLTNHVHVQESIDPTIRVAIYSPVNVLLTDSLGRRLGTDAYGQLVNDFGDKGFANGPEEHPRVYSILDPVSGDYTVTAVGTGEGPFTIQVAEQVHDPDPAEGTDGTEGEEELGLLTQYTGIATVGSVNNYHVAVPPSLLPAETLYGDVLQDGIVDARDVSMLLRMYLGLENPTPDAMRAGDVRPKPGISGRPYGNGIIEGDDLNWILRRYLNLERQP